MIGCRLDVSPTSIGRGYDVHRTLVSCGLDIGRTLVGRLSYIQVAVGQSDVIGFMSPPRVSWVAADVLRHCRRPDTSLQPSAVLPIRRRRLVISHRCGSHTPRHFRRGAGSFVRGQSEPRDRPAACRAKGWNWCTASGIAAAMGAESGGTGDASPQSRNQRGTSPQKSRFFSNFFLTL